uniref:Uncharacterized protein n=1 Tax=Panagrolaimus sp. JU765 TaxID=591449 RepID=A0AC34Q2M3_9BILA
MTVEKENLSTSELFSITTTNPQVFEKLKFIKTDQVFNDDESIVYGFAEGHVFEILSSKSSCRASMMGNFFGNDLTNLYLREIHVYLIPLARLFKKPGLTIEEIFADFMDMLDYSYSFEMLNQLCISKDGEHFSVNEAAVKEWYESLFFEMLLLCWKSKDMADNERIHFQDACYYDFLRYVPSELHYCIPYTPTEEKMNMNHSKDQEFAKPVKQEVIKPPPAKKSRTAINPNASKGTKSITSFFCKKA